MTILIAGGDSFTYGSELSDCTNEQHSNSTWSALLAHQLGMNYACVALPGASNSSITRRVMRACEKAKQSYDIAVTVMWTFSNRYEFRFTQDTGERDTPWYSLTPWTHESNSDRIRNTFVNPSDLHLQHHVNHNNNMNANGIGEFSKQFYMHVGNSEIYEWYSTYKEILFLQQYLVANNIPYLFTHVEPIFNEQSQLNDLDILRKQIDIDCFYTFDGFYRWASENNYQFGTTHPLEPAHIDFADKLFLHCKANNIL